LYQQLFYDKIDAQKNVDRLILFARIPFPPRCSLSTWATCAPTVATQMLRKLENHYRL
jgi:hypothetical protein